MSQSQDFENELHQVQKLVVSRSSAITQSGRACLVGVSGIGGSGKGFVAQRLIDRLKIEGWRVALLQTDDWFSLPGVRFGDTPHPLHYYHHAIRLEEMFEQAVKPLVKERSIDLTYEQVVEGASEAVSGRLVVDEIDIVVVEGIFLFRREYVGQFDVTVWVECCFETALQRAIGRRQEKLSDEETLRKYRELFHPAQRLHLAKDDPLSQIDVVVHNDR